MSFIDNDIQLLAAVKDGSMRGAKAALKAGANVDGSREQPVPPIVAATIADHASLVVFLLGQRADPDRPVTKEVPCSGAGTGMTAPGERALHIAARIGNVEIVRLLLKRSRADPNATDNTGYTPLMSTCSCPHVCAEVVRLLLEAGANPALAQEDGCIPLHAVALQGHMDLVDMLYSSAPDTLNCCPANRETPLYLACGEGNERMVSKLLSLGAMQPIPLDADRLCPLAYAVVEGFERVVRVLINEGGIRAVGGGLPLAQALGVAVTAQHARILRLLLMVDGEEKRSALAKTNLGGKRLLHYGAGYCYPAAVSILLEAGADEATRDSEGRIPRDVIGVDFGLRIKVQMVRWKEVAIRRMLQRGPAYRARSWAWPSDQEADAGVSGDDDTATAAAALSSPPGVPKAPVIGVRIFRPTEKSSRKFFVRLIGRYCAKD